MVTKKKLKRRRIEGGDSSQAKSSPQKIKLTYKPITSNRLKRRRQAGSMNFKTLMPVLFGIIIVVAVVFIVTSPAPDTGNGPPGEYAIPYSVTTIHEETIKLSTYYGKVVFYYFTGATCIPCKMQLPYLVDAYNYYKYSDKIEIFSFDVQGHSINELLTWESDNDITWKVCQDSGLIISTYFSISAMPTLVICDETGHEINRYIGANDNQTIWAIFESAIN